MLASRSTIIVSLLLLVVPTCAYAQVAAVSVGFSENTPEAQFDGSTLTIQYTSMLDSITVQEAGLLSGFTNVGFSLTTTYEKGVHYNGDIWGWFTGGSLSLTFADGQDAYEVSGDVYVFMLKIDASAGGPTPFTQMSGRGWFTTLVADLPQNPTGVWAWMSPLLSSFLPANEVRLDHELPSDYWLGPTAWPDGDLDGISLIPDDGPGPPAIPEPGMLALMAVGSLMTLRRLTAYRRHSHAQ